MSMRPSVIKRNLSADRPSLVVTLHLCDPVVYELASQIGFDGIWLCLEHGRHSVETAAELIRATRGGDIDVIARPGNGEFTRLSRLLEVGARGIMYPRCASVEEAQKVVEFTKFAPIGKRGFDGGGADAPYGLTPMVDYLQQANDETFLIIQLEDQAAVDQAEAIAALDGVDVLMLGPGDFSILEGIPGQMNHPKIAAAQEKIATAARNAGKHWAAIAFTPEQAPELVQQGARIIYHQVDLCLLRDEMKRVREAIQF